jgi:uncharacterized membrane protein
MNIKISNYWYRLNSSFLFLPATLAVASLVLYFVTTAIDKAVGYPHGAQYWWMYRGGPDGAETILSTLSGSMAAVAGVVFSITVVVLSLASSQFGPRLIRSFMHVRANQLVLGTFVATFTYGVLVLRTVDASPGSVFVPGFSVNVAIVAALLSLGLLIYFIHSVSESIQAQNIIDRVRRDLDDAIDRIIPERQNDAKEMAGQSAARTYTIPDKCDRNACQVLAADSGYLQAIDDDALLDIAVEENLLLHLGYRPGHFITRGNVLVTVWPGDKVDPRLTDAINSVFILGRERTLEQDVEYAISQLAEIAVRALSSGINDPITAITCIDWLGASLCRLAGRKLPSAHRYDDTHRLRIISKPYTFAGMVDAAFNMIRQNTETVPAVSIHLLEVLATVAAQTRSKDDRAVLLRHVRMIHEACRRKMDSDNDRGDLETRYRDALKMFEGETDGQSLNQDA